ncbi:hypothetical protein RB195_010086 [Necator americanus]|uniref:Uncharacterized protein n=1 Tax=Necator americanus TaxID=51031 RepID=A0ABR1CY79_NECAM
MVSLKPGRLLRYLYVPFAALQETRIADRHVISIGEYTTYCGDADEKKIGGCARNDYNNLVVEFGSIQFGRLDAPLYDCRIADDFCFDFDVQQVAIEIEAKPKMGLDQQSDVPRKA